QFLQFTQFGPQSYCVSCRQFGRFSRRSLATHVGAAKMAASLSENRDGYSNVGKTCLSDAGGENAAMSSFLHRATESRLAAFGQKLLMLAHQTAQERAVRPSPASCGHPLGSSADQVQIPGFRAVDNQLLSIASMAGTTDRRARGSLSSHLRICAGCRRLVMQISAGAARCLTPRAEPSSGPPPGWPAHI
ncbi:hypothetical protein, partial [Methylobacterium sp. GC_Met_2]|uniref:hypothetical protein n=1 Tax=Methylobacterium sp. GC_Met_2 TaxID=2937376 RepID=UPI00226B4921